MQKKPTGKKHQKGDSVPSKTLYHPGFVNGLELLLWPYREKISIDPEHPLSTEGIRMDALVIKKDPSLEISSDICRAFRTHNIIEYKRSDDALNIDVIAKLMAYAHLYKSQGKTVNAIPYEEVSATIYRHALPKKVFRKLREYHATIIEKHPGVYSVDGFAPFPVQVLVGKQLDTKEYAMFKVLRKGASDEEIRSFKDMTVQVKDTAFQKIVDAIYQVSVNANKETYYRLQKEDPAMCEALKDLMEDYIEEEVVKRTTDRLNEAENRVSEAENRRIEDIISVYHDDLKLSPEEIIRKVTDRFGFDPETAKKHVVRVLQSYT